MKGADKVAYGAAHKMATKLSEMLGARLVDKTSHDFAEFSEYEYQSRLEDRVCDFRERAKV